MLCKPLAFLPVSSDSGDPWMPLLVRKNHLGEILKILMPGPQPRDTVSVSWGMAQNWSESNI